MPLGAKLDEDLSPLVAEPLRAAGCDVATVVGQGWSGMNDQELWSRLVNERRLFITADKGFGDIRRYRPGQHPGIVVLRADRESIVDYKILLAKLIENYSIQDLVGHLTVVTSRGIRIRRAS